MHNVLQRQLRRLALDEAEPPGIDEWRELLTGISSTYDDMDRGPYLVEHSMETSSRQMRESNATVAEERDKFASSFKAAPNAMAMVDTAGIVVEVNRALDEMLEYAPDEMIGHDVTQFFSPDERERAQTVIRELATAQVTVSRHHRRLLNRNGAALIAEVQARTILGADRNPKMILMWFDDVTEKNRLEVELRHSQKLESIGRLAAGIAHEINTPIQFVGDNVSFLPPMISLAKSISRTRPTSTTFVSTCRPRSHPRSTVSVGWRALSSR